MGAGVDDRSIESRSQIFANTDRIEVMCMRTQTQSNILLPHSLRVDTQGLLFKMKINPRFRSRLDESCLSDSIHLPHTDPHEATNVIDQS